MYRVVKSKHVSYQKFMDGFLINLRDERYWSAEKIHQPSGGLVKPKFMHLNTAKYDSRPPKTNTAKYKTRLFERNVDPKFESM